MSLHGRAITVTGPGTYARRQTLQAMGLRFDGRSKSWMGTVSDPTGIYEFKLRTDRGPREAVEILVVGAVTSIERTGNVLSPAVNAWHRETAHGAKLTEDS